MTWGGMVDVYTCTREDPCMGRRSTPSVGRLTVLHMVGVVRLQNGQLIGWRVLDCGWKVNLVHYSCNAQVRKLNLKQECDHQ